MNGKMQKKPISPPQIAVQCTTQLGLCKSTTSNLLWLNFYHRNYKGKICINILYLHLFIKSLFTILVAALFPLISQCDIYMSRSVVNDIRTVYHWQREYITLRNGNILHYKLFAFSVGTI